jgi:hypothetical protein
MAEACRACGGVTAPFADAVVMGSTPAHFERCGSCGMVMAAEPDWLEAAYSAAITSLDIGLLDRCLLLANVTCAVLRSERLRDGRFLDWAGGYGTLTRLMRDRGYDFSHWDPLAENVFARGHDDRAPEQQRFDLVTGFEVLEHLVDPVEELADVARGTDRLLMTTQLLPEPVPAPGEWWYYTLETGQHISLYTRESVQRLARRLGFDGAVSGQFLHLFHRGPVSATTRALVRRPQIAYGLGLLASVPDRRHSLLGDDLSGLTDSPPRRS